MNGPDVNAVPRLRPGLRVKFDGTRNSTLLLMPECTVKLNASAAEIITLIDGARTIKQIVSLLEDKFAAEGIHDDVIEFVLDARDKGWIQV